MTDKQLIETLRNIKEHCSKQIEVIGYYPTTKIHSCNECKFLRASASKRGNICQLTKLIGNLAREPRYWDMDAIERIINE